MQQRERGISGKGSARRQPLQITFPVGQCLMVGQLITFRLPAGCAAPLCIDSEAVEPVISDGQNCVFCLDVPAPHGTAKQAAALQVTGSAENAMQLIGQQQELAG